MVRTGDVKDMQLRLAIVNRGEAAMRLIHAVRELNARDGHSIETIALPILTFRTTGPITLTSANTTATVGVQATARGPASNLAANTVYGATITTGVKDLAGNALASNLAWSFTTAATTAAIRSKSSNSSLSRTQVLFFRWLASRNSIAAHATRRCRSRLIR